MCIGYSLGSNRYYLFEDSKMTSINELENTLNTAEASGYRETPENQFLEVIAEGIVFICKELQYMNTKK